MLSISIFQSNNFSLTVFWSELKLTFNYIMPLLEMYFTPDHRFFQTESTSYELGAEKREMIRTTSLSLQSSRPSKGDQISKILETF